MTLTVTLTTTRAIIQYLVVISGRNVMSSERTESRRQSREGHFEKVIFEDDVNDRTRFPSLLFYFYNLQAALAKVRVRVRVRV
jgi:hypothetical protein